jgi:apolipoprotein N-acyltransferase
VDPPKDNTEERKKVVNSWAFPSVKDGFIAGGLCVLTILLTYLSTMAYPDTMPGPTWIVSLMAFTPLLAGSLMYRHCLSQMYIVTFVGFVVSCILIPVSMGVEFYLGFIPGLMFWVLSAGSLHLWSYALPEDHHVDVQLISRITCAMGIVYYTLNSLFGNMASIALDFFRAPFLLQPISVFGFATLEMLVIFTNGALAWYVWAVVKTKKPFPIHVTRWFTNPVYFMVVFWVLWIVIAGIITAAHKPIGSVKVATVGSPSNSFDDQTHAEELGTMMRTQVDATGARFVVAPEAILSGGPPGVTITCESWISDHINPKMAGSGAFYTVGCASIREGPCWSDNMAYTVDPSGKIVGRYGKEHPTPGEESCDKTGPIIMNSGPIAGSVKNGKSMVPDTLENIKFSTIICYDADFTDSTAKAADLGAQLILDPSNDWYEVRHHYGTAIIRAVENRVAVVKSESRYDAVIVDPFGKIVAGGIGKNVNLAGEVSISTPLKRNWMRQNSPYWIAITLFAVFTAMDIYTLVKRRRATADQ